MPDRKRRNSSSITGFDFIAKDDPVAADRLPDLLEKKYKLLASNPHMGPAEIVQSRAGKFRSTRSL
jgi:plasmid stabilization system protein ParE